MPIAVADRKQNGSGLQTAHFLARNSENLVISDQILAVPLKFATVPD
jgi:hypothetical protein